MQHGLYDVLDPQFNRTEWRIQRIGWVVIALLLVLVIAGLFGGGVFSQATVSSKSENHEVAVSYARFGRAESTLALELMVFVPGASGSQVTASLSGDVLEQASIQSISPSPASESLDGDRVVYSWDVEDWSRPVTVRIEYEARHWRKHNSEVQVRAGEQSLGTLSFGQFLFP